MITRRRGGTNRRGGRNTKNTEANNQREKEAPASRRRQRTRGNKTGAGNKRHGDLKQASSASKQQRRQRRPRCSGNNKGQPLVRKRSLSNSITVSRNSIHNAWKKDLGGLIRWYVNLDGISNNVDEAMTTIENLYTSQNCDVQATREALLQLIASVTNDVDAKSRPTDQWLQFRMIIENPNPPSSSKGVSSTIAMNDGITYDTIADGKGIVLKTMTRPGDGPAHASNMWTVVVIPPWAVGRSFYFDAFNHSPLDLSCEMTIDGHSAAKNAPIPAHSERTIRPASHRYFESHEWRLAPSRRIPLKQLTSLGNDRGQQNSSQQNPNLSSSLRNSPRYNGIRPLNKTQRVSYEHFPDPSDCGWKFTGSREESRVEFFEKTLNNGSICRMDFYYTTGTVKTVLYHPTQQRTTQLFRKCCLANDPDVFRKILQDPRYHTNIGYHRRPAPGQNQQQRDAPQDHTQGDETMEQEGDNNYGMEEDDIEGTNTEGGTAYFAKNEDYVFDTAGHVNREAAMSQLQPTPEFQAWEQATRQDWACVHAKCYVSLRRYMRPADSARGGRIRNEDEPMALPDMAPIVNVQAAENATLSTIFHSTGPSNTSHHKSRVRMERVKGLNDDPEWGTGPVFDLKLYYRPVVNPSEEDDDSTLESEDEENNGMDSEMTNNDADQTIPLAEKLRDEMPLDVYKAEKTDQLHRWFQQCKASNEEEAEAKVIEAQRNIQAASDTKAVDDHLKVYWDWHLQQEWSQGNLGSS